MREDNKLDQYVRQHRAEFDRVESTPRERIWAAMQKQTDLSPVSPWTITLGRNWRWSIAAGLALLIGLGIWWQHEQRTHPPVPELATYFPELAAQEQEYQRLIEQREGFPPFLVLHHLQQPLVVEAVAVPGFPQAVAEARAGTTIPLLDRLEQGDGGIEIAFPEAKKCLIAELIAPTHQTLAILLLIAATADRRIHQLFLEAQGLGSVALFPGQFGLAAPTGGLFARRFLAQPAQRRQLFAVPEAGLEIAPLGGVTQTKGELLLPPVGDTTQQGDTSQGQPEPVTGQGVAAQRQSDQAESPSFYVEGHRF